MEGRCSCRCGSDRSDPIRGGGGGGCRVNNNGTEKAPAVNGVSCNNDNSKDDAVNSGRRIDDECVDHNIMYLLSGVIAAVIVSTSWLHRGDL